MLVYPERDTRSRPHSRLTRGGVDASLAIDTKRRLHWQCHLPITKPKVSATGTDEYLALAAVLAIMAGVFVILARVVGLAFLARSVLAGFLTGVGIQVALGQISSMLGLKGGGHGTLQKIRADIQQLDQINYKALAVALAVLVVIVGARKISERIPGALIAVAELS